MREYLAWARGRQYSPQTLRHYDYALRTFAAWLAARGLGRLQDVTRSDLEAYRSHLQAKGLSAGSCENHLQWTRKLFRWMEKTGRLFLDPTAGVIVPKRLRRLLPVPTEAEMRRLLAQPDVSRPVGIRDRAWLEVAYGCGLRRGELVRLTIFDPDLQRGTLRVLGKGRKERIVPLGRQGLYWLKRYLEHARPKLLGGRLNTEALWIGSRHEPLGGMAMRQQLWNYARRAKIQTLICLHSLRRACATHMLRHGAHPVQIQMLLGHASLRHLSQYLEVTITDLKKTHRQSNPGK